MPLKNSRKKKRRQKAKLLCWLLIIVCLLTYGSVWIGRRSMPVLRQIAIHEARNVTSAILLEAVRAENFSLERHDETYLTSQIHNAMNGIVSRAHERFKAIEIDVLSSDMSDRRNLPAGVIYQVPLGTIIHLPFLANAGPMIPIRMRLLGDVGAGMKSKVTPYGINNALLEILVEFTVRVQVISPLLAEEIKVVQEIPLALEVFEGAVPQYLPWNRQME